VTQDSRINFGVLLAMYSAVMLLAPITCFADCTVQGAAEVELGVSRPQNITQLLRNLKLAFDRGPLLESEFYDDNNLLKFFNGASVQWRSITTSGMYEADITPGPQLSEIRRITVRTWKNGAPLWDGEVHLEVSASAELTLGRVRKVFGQEDRTVFPEGLNHPMAANAYVLPTPFGIEYIKTTPPTVWSCRAMREEVKFSADVHPGDWHGLRLNGLNPQYLPDKPMVISISMKARTE
jgi:hypothetical protein